MYTEAFKESCKRHFIHNKYREYVNRGFYQPDATTPTRDIKKLAELEQSVVELIQSEDRALYVGVSRRKQ